MTWVLGAGIPFGYAALISDVRVTWSTGLHLDCLQKIYPIGAGLMAGFSGSVAVGFHMIDIMKRQYGADVGQLYPVKRMAWHWHRFAKWYYAKFVRPEFKPLGCELMIAGVSPEQCGPFGFCSHAVSMRAPDFSPTFVVPNTWGSIGSGAQHPDAQLFADPEQFMRVFAHGEVMNPGGVATMVAHSVADSLENQPLDSVSPIIQVGIVRPATHVFKMLRRQHSGPWTIAREEDAETNELVTSWNDFRKVTSAAGLDAQAAVAE